MAKQITTWSGLMKVLEQETERAVAYAGEQIKRILHDNVQNLWYRARDYDYKYERTMDILNSVTVETLKQGKNGYSARIFFDETKIHPEHTDDAFFNKHMSLDGSTSYEGQSIGLWVVSFMESGMRSPYGSFTGAGFVEETDRVAREDAVYLIEESLRKAGFETVVVG